MMATTVARGIFEVISGKETYRTDLVNKTCTCKGWYYTKHCKHLKLFGVKR